jgi:hypothetical protein
MSKESDAFGLIWINSCDSFGYLNIDTLKTDLLTHKCMRYKAVKIDYLERS